MSQEKMTMQLLEEVNAIITGSHIVYTSGKHGDAYVNKDAVYPHTQLTSDLCQAMATKIVQENEDVDTVIAPAIGGVILSQWTAFHLSKSLRREVMSIYAEKDPESGEFIIKRGYDKYVKDKKVVVVEDILNTGGSVRKVVDAVRLTGGTVAAVLALCNRGSVTKESIGNPPHLCSLTNVTLSSWEEAECPLCKQNVPINMEVGKGREYLARK